MTHIVDTDEYISAICEMIADGKTNIPLPIVGDSMRPFLKNNDTVYLSPLSGKVRRGDILLFLRCDGHGVLHRAIKVTNEKIYMLGDSQLEAEPVLPSMVIARATSVKRRTCRTSSSKEKLITSHSPIWCFYKYIYPKSARARRILSHMRNFVRKNADSQTS